MKHLLKVCYNKGNYDEGTWNLVCYNESLLYLGFVIPRECIRSLLGRIQGTKHLVCYTGRFIISRVHFIGVPLYILE